MTQTAFRLTMAAVVVMGATAGGYFCRRLSIAGDRTAKFIMTFVAVVGYPIVGALSIWGIKLHPADAALPFLATIHMVAMTFISLAAARYVTKEREETGLFALAGGTGNNGFTMGAFVLYFLYGEPGMGLSNLYFLLFMPTIVLLHYPLAKHFSEVQSGGSVWDLILKTLFDWRSIGLPVSLVGIALSVMGVPRPPEITDWHILDVLVFTITPMAFFGIGLHLHLGRLGPLKRMLTGVAVMRFAVGAIVGILLAVSICWTPWAFTGVRWNVFVFQGFVPTSVTMVAMANMFSLRPREASALFVINTAMYLVLVLPLVLLIFG